MIINRLKRRVSLIIQTIFRHVRLIVVIVGLIVITIFISKISFTIPSSNFTFNFKSQIESLSTLDQTKDHTLIFLPEATPKIIIYNHSSSSYSQILINPQIRSLTQRKPLKEILNDPDLVKLFVVEVIGLPLHYYEFGNMNPTQKTLIFKLLSQQPETEISLTDNSGNGQPDFFEYYTDGKVDTINQLVPKKLDYSLLRTYLLQKFIR